jgi:hypothetical protein
VTLHCDGPYCLTTAFGDRLPEGWLVVRWVPGILSPPGFKPPPTKYACCKRCAEAMCAVPVPNPLDNLE